MAETPSGAEGEVGFAKQSAKGTAATAFYMALLTRFKWKPDQVTDEGEPEIGGDLDVGRAERWGLKEVPFSGEARFRPGHLGLLLLGYGLQHRSGGFIFWDGVNDQIKITDTGGTATLDLITDGGLVAGTAYTGAQVAAALHTAANASATLQGTYTVTHSTVTQKFTIAAAGTATLTLVWTDSHLTKMLANLLGFDHSADDSGALTYTADEARDATGRWSFRDGRNGTIRVTDAGGGPVDVDLLSSTGYKLAARVPYNAWSVCAGLKAVLDADMTLSGEYIITYSAATHLFTIASSSATLTIAWNHANSNLEDDLGYSNAAADSGSTSYTADYTIWPAARHYFTPYPAGSSFPWLSILDKFDQSATLNTRLRDARINQLTFRAEDASPLRITFEGSALYEADATGSETETVESEAMGTPNTNDDNGHVNWGATDDYPLARLELQTNWDKEIEPALATGGPRSIVPRRRTAGGTLRVYLGSEASAGQFRATFYGSASGAEPDNTIVERPLDVLFVSGTAVSGALAPGQASDGEDFYGVRFEAPECQLMNYELEKAGDALIAGDLAVHISREAADWGITLINGEDRALYA